MIIRSLFGRSSILLAATIFLAGCRFGEQYTPPVSTAPVSVAPPPADYDRGTLPGLVSSADPRATQAGVFMLRQGGSATDAAIATMLALTVVEPQSSGIGGGGFYLRSDKSGAIMSLDGRETAPMVATGNWFLDEDGEPLGYREAVLSGLSVGVPGNIRLAGTAHKRYGKLDWAELFQPAINLARNGFHITPRFHDFLTRYKNRASNTAEGLALFYDAAGEPLPANTKVTNVALADTLEQIAANGPDWFYESAFAGEIMRTVASQTPHDVAMNRFDLVQYKAKERAPVCGQYRSYSICGMGPPSSGATTVYAILKQLERFDLTAMGKDDPKVWHLFAESQRLAYADREIYLADGDFVRVPVAGLMDTDYLARRSALLDPAKAMESVSAGTPPGALAELADGDEPAERGTSHFVAADRQGNVVSYTSTIEGPFGSGLMAGGFYLNNELTDFSFVPEKDGRLVANRVEGGKRPRSSMSPTIVFDSEGNPVIAVGAAGGGTIPVQVAKALMGIIDFNLTATEAINLPMVYSPRDTVVLEEGRNLEELKAALTALGHKQIVERSLPSKANAAQLIGGHWEGAADPRSEGRAFSE